MVAMMSSAETKFLLAALIIVTFKSSGGRVMSGIVGKDDQREEHVLLRVKDDSLAKQLRQLLAGTEAKAKSVQIDLRFTGVYAQRGIHRNCD